MVSWLKDKVLFHLKEMNNALYQNCTQILDSNKEQHERVLLVLKSSIQLFLQDVKALLGEWISDRVEQRVSEDTQVRAELLPEAKQIQAQLEGDIEPASLINFVEKIFKNPSLRVDLLPSLVNALREFVNNSEFESKDKHFNIALLSSHDNQSNDKLENVFKIVLESEIETRELLTSQFYDFVASSVQSELIILNQTKEFQHALEDLKESLEDNEKIVSVLRHLLALKPRENFFKMSVHSGLTPQDISNQLEPFIESAKECKNVGYVFTIFYDEVNTTSSCAGLFKEIIFDNKLMGKELPSNLFV